MFYSYSSITVIGSQRKQGNCVADKPYITLPLPILKIFFSVSDQFFTKNILIIVSTCYYLLFVQLGSSRPSTLDPGALGARISLGASSLMYGGLKAICRNFGQSPTQSPSRGIRVSSCLLYVLICSIRNYAFKSQICDDICVLGDKLRLLALQSGILLWGPSPFVRVQGKVPLCLASTILNPYTRASKHGERSIYMSLQIYLFSNISFIAEITPQLFLKANTY